MKYDPQHWCAECQRYHDHAGMIARKEKQWAACHRASNRLMDMAWPDKKTRSIAPTATWAEIIAGELGIEIPGYDDETDKRTWSNE